jgi:hypothetical protein
MTKDELIVGYTGLDSGAWVAVIQETIKTYFDAEPDNPHPQCETADWLPMVVRQIVERHDEHMARPLPRRPFERFRKARPPREPYDGNMSGTLVVAAILTTWTMRLSRTKSYDPRRPVALRRRGLERTRANAAALVDCIYDESRDPEYFELPYWDNPMALVATDGDFV